MLDFSSALYLGMHHPSRTLRPWDSLTFGAPAALREPEGDVMVAQQIADLQGCELAVLAPSTLHLFWDLFGTFGGKDTTIYMDDGVYPIARWGAERAKSFGASVRTFPHYDPSALMNMIRKSRDPGRRMLLIDGFCPACGRPAPISDYLSVLGNSGSLVMDDTQAFGILGHLPSRHNPYGLGGGGMLQWSNTARDHRVLSITSLAKGFGVPMAVLSGSSDVVKRFKDRSRIRVHCSPPSNALIHAAEHAIAVNQKVGDKLRQRLLRLVSYFRNLMAKAGFMLKGGLFPVQTLLGANINDAESLYNKLLHNGIQTVLHHGRAVKSALISFLITSRHRFSDIEYLVGTLNESIKQIWRGADYVRT